MSDSYRPRPDNDSTFGRFEVVFENTGHRRIGSGYTVSVDSHTECDTIGD